MQTKFGLLHCSCTSLQFQAPSFGNHNFKGYSIFFLKLININTFYCQEENTTMSVSSTSMCAIHPLVLFDAQLGRLFYLEILSIPLGNLDGMAFPLYKPLETKGEE